MRLIIDVDRDVGVEWLQLFGKELIGQRVEAIRAPAQPGPFQKIKPENILIVNKKVCFNYIQITNTTL